MLVAAAVVPAPPLLVPQIAAAPAGAGELRRACDDAVRTVLAAAPDLVVVVGSAPRTGTWSGSWDWRGFGVPAPAVAPPARLPLALAVGSWLLDRHGDSRDRRRLGVHPACDTGSCAALGRAASSARRRVALLVCGDGSARRAVEAPGHLHPSAQAWDDQVAAALASADVGALATLSPSDSSELMASGRVGWQALAGAAAEHAAGWHGELLYSAAPHGVGYHVACWTPRT